MEWGDFIIRYLYMKNVVSSSSKMRNKERDSVIELKELNEKRESKRIHI